MKKYKIPLLTMVALLLLSMFTTQSCRKLSDFQDENFINNEFYEIANLSDEFTIDGIVAVPLINSTFTLEDFIPQNLDSSFFVEVDNNDLMHLRMYFKDVASMDFSKIYVGQSLTAGTTIPAHTYSIRTDTSKLKLYENALTGKLFFKNPKFTFIFKNEIPVINYFNLDSIIFHNQFLEPISATPEINHIIETPVYAGGVDTTYILIDKTDLDVLPEIFSPIPKFLSFFISIGNDVDQTVAYNLTGEEKISMDVDVDVPMEARLEDFVLGDTVDFNFASDTNNIEQIKAITVKLIFDNMIPAGGVANITFHDEDSYGVINTNDTILDLRNDDNTRFSFKSAITDGSGESTTSAKSDFVIHLTQEQLSTLKTHNATKIVVTGTFNSYESDNPDKYVKILSTNTLGIKLGVRVDFEGSTTDIPQ